MVPERNYQYLNASYCWATFNITNNLCSEKGADNTSQERTALKSCKLNNYWINSMGTLYHSTFWIFA